MLSCCWYLIQFIHLVWDETLDCRTQVWPYHRTCNAMIWEKRQCWKSTATRAKLNNALPHHWGVSNNGCGCVSLEEDVVWSKILNCGDKLDLNEAALSQDWPLVPCCDRWPWITNINPRLAPQTVCDEQSYTCIEKEILAGKIQVCDCMFLCVSACVWQKEQSRTLRERGNNRQNSLTATRCVVHVPSFFYFCLSVLYRRQHLAGVICFVFSFMCSCANGPTVPALIRINSNQALSCATGEHSLQSGSREVCKGFDV